MEVEKKYCQSIRKCIPQAEFIWVNESMARKIYIGYIKDGEDDDEINQPTTEGGGGCDK